MLWVVAWLCPQLYNSSLSFQEIKLEEGAKSATLFPHPRRNPTEHGVVHSR